jgi:hypothetical protein
MDWDRVWGIFEGAGYMSRLAETRRSCGLTASREPAGPSPEPCTESPDTPSTDKVPVQWTISTASDFAGSTCCNPLRFATDE